MFTGIIRGVCKIQEIVPHDGVISYAIEFTPELLKELTVGSSVAIDGVCLTVTKIHQTTVWFDVIEETLLRTTFSEYSVGSFVNIERAAKFGNEIGGHLLSGHVFGRVAIEQKMIRQSSCIFWLRCPELWMKYFFQKGFIALNGVSLTLVDVDPKGLFSVHLIPETLKATTFSQKNVGDQINVEIDAQTQAIVETIERMQN
jgi:riboflavin synthase